MATLPWVTTVQLQISHLFKQKEHENRSPCLSRSMQFENSGNLGMRAENTHVQTAFVAIDDAAFFIYVKS